MSATIFPTVHLNGTSSSELLDQILKAREALKDASTALQQTCPNGRDYYPQGPEALGKAMGEYLNRVSHLNEVYCELEQIAQAISDQQNARRAPVREHNQLARQRAYHAR